MTGICKPYTVGRADWKGCGRVLMKLGEFGQQEENVKWAEKQSPDIFSMGAELLTSLYKNSLCTIALLRQ
jgi:hypothetical protein